jgi:hypothetical protein
MSTNYDLDALFHPNVELGEENPVNKIEYNPSAEKGQGGVYKAIIRFVAYWADPPHSIIEKWVCWLVDPVTNRGRYVDCPSSVGKPSILQDMFFKLRKSESVLEQAKANTFSRRHSFTAIIQVIKDEQNKESEGKLLVWKFGKKIWEKIEAEKKPVIGEPHEPFDLLDGKAFAVIVTKVSGFNNYDQSKFLDKKVPLLIPVGKDGKIVPFGPDVVKLNPINERTPRETVFDFLKNNSPDLNKYGFKEWDQETHDYVNQVIVTVTGQTPSAGYADVRNAKSQNVSAQSKPAAASKTGITSTDLSLDDLNLNNNTLSDLDLPDVGGSDFGIPGDLDDALAGI